MLLLDITVVNVALPAIREDLGAGDQYVGLPTRSFRQALFGPIPVTPRGQLTSRSLWGIATIGPLG
jgi:hypothetical protein